jgi:hypothetical protein
MGSVFALKSFSRPQLKLFGAEALPMREKAALSVVGSHPFVVELVNTYKNPKKLYVFGRVRHAARFADSERTRKSSRAPTSLHTCVFFKFSNVGFCPPALVV